MRILPSFFLLAALPLSLLGGVNTMVMRDGRTFSGRMIDGNSGTIAFEDDNGRQYRFRTNEIQSIVFDNRGGDSRNNNSDYRGNRGNAGPLRVLPAGTELAVRTTTTINSKDATDGQVYSSTIERDVLDGSGAVLIPRGSPAELVIRAANGGGIRNSSNLVLDVQSVTVNGQRYQINTEDVSRSGGRQGIGANKRTGEFVGGGTALGTLLGAVAGGGKGALIGALAGAAAGAGAQVLTKGSEVRVPSETVLTFRLDQQVNLDSRY